MNITDLETRIETNIDAMTLGVFNHTRTKALLIEAVDKLEELNHENMRLRSDFTNLDAQVTTLLHERNHALDEVEHRKNLAAELAQGAPAQLEAKYYNLIFAHIDLKRELAECKADNKIMNDMIVEDDLADMSFEELAANQTYADQNFNLDAQLAKMRAEYMNRS